MWKNQQKGVRIGSTYILVPKVRTVSDELFGGDIRKTE